MKKRFSLYIYIIIILVSSIVVLNLKQWKSDDFFIYDYNIYYSYLPAAVVHQSLDFEFRHEDQFNSKKHRILGTNLENGNFVPKMSFGMAILYAPFFIIAHLIALMTGCSADGYSIIYKILAIVGHLCYVFLGLFYLRKILLKYFDDFITGLTLFSIVFCTNYMHYSMVEIGMTHTYSFCLFALFSWNTIRWHEAPKKRRSNFLGLLTGLIVLARPTNGIIVLVFLFFSLTNKNSIKKKYDLLTDNWKHIFLIIFIGVLVLLPQFLFWKHISGSFYFFTYGQEGFYFSSPQFFNGLFSYRKGWLLYTPIMVFSFFGLYTLFKKRNQFAMSIFIFTSLNCFIVFSWWCWWYGASFGQRAMIESYVILAIPLAAFFQVFSQKKILFIISLLIIIITGGVNIIQTNQYQHYIHYDAMTKKAYWSVFLGLNKKENPYYHFKYFISPDYAAALKGEKEFDNPAYDEKQIKERAKIIKGNKEWFGTIKREAEDLGEDVEKVLMRSSRTYYYKQKKSR